MALSTELEMRLNADGHLSKRLKLAENAYCSSDLAISGKQDIIVQWLCNVTPTHLEVWKNLSFCMNRNRSSNQESFLHETKRILIDTIIDELKLRHENVPDEVLSTFNEVLSTPDMQQYLQSNIDKLCSMLRELFLRIKSDDLRRSTTDISSREQYVLKTLENVVHMYKQCSGKDELAEKLFNHVLSPLCALIDRKCKDKSNRVGAETHKCIQQILFGKARYKEYKEYSEGKEGEYLPLKLFSTITQLASEIDPNQLQVTLSCVFAAAVGSYKNDSLLIDRIFRGFVNSSGIYATNVFNSLIEYLADVPLDYDNKIDNLSLTEYLGNLIDETIGKENFSDVQYALLSNIAGLNPLVVESKVQNIFKRILLEDRKTELDKELYVKLLIGILNASSKLRRQQKLIPWILLALESVLAENKDCSLLAREILPHEFCSQFTLLISGSQSPQIIAIARSFKFHFKSNCVDKYGKDSRNQISLMTECIGSLFVSFLKGIRIHDYSVPLILQQTFVTALGELGDVLSELNKKVSDDSQDGRLLPILFEITSSWVKVQRLVCTYAPEANAQSKSEPINKNDLEKLIAVVEDSNEICYRNALNNFLLYRIKLNINPHKPKEKLEGLIGGIEDFGLIIVEDYPELIPLLDFDQLSELASLILKDIIASKNSIEKWREIFQRDIIQENERFNIAILCHALRIIGSVIHGSASAAIVSRINLIQILENYTSEAAVPALNYERLISDIVKWPNLDKLDSSKIEKCLEILLCVPLSWFNVNLRTMIFVTTYVISRELQNDKEIRSLCEKILNDTVEEGALTVFNFIDMTSLMPCLPESEVLQRVFNMSLRNADPSSFLEHVAKLDYCPEKAVPVVLSCIEQVKPKLNNDQKPAFGKVEKKLVKRSLSKVEKKSKSVQKTQSLTIALRMAIGDNRVKEKLKESVKHTLLSIFMAGDVEEEETLPDENQNTDCNKELMKEGFELATLVLQHRKRLDVPEPLIASIWAMVFEYPQTKLLVPLLEATGLNMLKQILSSLNMETERHLRANDITRLNNTLGVWNIVIKTNMSSVKNKFRLGAVQTLLQSLQIFEISSEIWPDLIKLLLTLVTTGHMQLSGAYIDMIMSTAAKALSEGNLLVYDDVLVLCLALLRERVQLMTDRLPMLLQLYGKAVGLVIRQAKNKDAAYDHQLGLCVLNVEKVSRALIKLRRDVVRICPDIIANLVTEFGGKDLQPATKESLKACVNNLMSICDAYGVNLLSRVLPAAKREIFKDLSETYKKFHRFTGKI